MVMNQFFRSIPSPSQTGQSALRPGISKPFKLYQIRYGHQRSDGFAVPRDQDRLPLFSFSNTDGKMGFGFGDRNFL